SGALGAARHVAAVRAARCRSCLVEPCGRMSRLEPGDCRPARRAEVRAPAPLAVPATARYLVPGRGPGRRVTPAEKTLSRRATAACSLTFVTFEPCPVAPRPGTRYRAVALAGMARCRCRYASDGMTSSASFSKS